MRKPFSEYARGFSLIELLVAISVILLLSGMTLGGLRSFKTHQVIHQSAANFEMILELARAVALSEEESVFLVLADMTSEPVGAPMRSYTFIRNLSDPELLQPWQFLPEDVVFAEDPDSVEIDLMTEDPIDVLENSFPDQDQGSIVEGRIRVIVEVTPEGTFRSGSDSELQTVSLLLERGTWTATAAMDNRYLPMHIYRDKIPLDAVRILFRPRTGVVRIQDKEELP